MREEHLRQNFTCRGGISSAFTSLRRGEHRTRRGRLSFKPRGRKNVCLLESSQGKEHFVNHYSLSIWPKNCGFFFFFSIWVAQTLGKFHHINSQFTVLGGSPEAGTLKLVLLNFHPKPNRLVIFSHPLNLIK